MKTTYKIMSFDGKEHTELTTQKTEKERNFTYDLFKNILKNANIRILQEDNTAFIYAVNDKVINMYKIEDYKL